LKAAQLTKLNESATTSASPPKQFLKFPKNNVVTKPLLSLPSSNKRDFTSTKNRTQLNSQPYKSLTHAFMSERRSKGLCYFCDEPFTPTHALTHKKLEIHVKSMMIDHQIWRRRIHLKIFSRILDPHICVHAFMGVANFKTESNGVFQETTNPHPY